jgi:hypothetical protein
MGVNDASPRNQNQRGIRHLAGPSWRFAGPRLERSDVTVGHMVAQTRRQ